MSLKNWRVRIVFGALTLAATPVLAQQAGGTSNYQLLVDGKPMDVEAGKEFSVTTAKGETLRLELREKSTRTYQDDWVTFQYPIKLSVAETQEEGVRQVVLMNASGAGLIVQEYTGVDPADIIDFMITQLVKDEVKANYKQSEKAYSLKLADGKLLKGKTKTLTQKNKQMVYNLGAWSGENEGILVVLFQSKDGTDDDQSNQQQFDDILKTLKIRR